jgi:glycosyltransferase involved in cell wall biosynthesis
MKKPLITVIVAVYNAQKTIVRLADSLKAQTMRDFEVLLIDDGSTDASGDICDSIAQSDGRFRVFHKPNEGIGSTRQFGIDHASGLYTIHADADDWVEPDYLELLYNEAVSSGADMVICDVLMEKGKRVIHLNEQPKAYDRVTMIDELVNRLQNGPCNKLVRRSLYTDNHISYVPGLSYGEDQLVNIQLIKAGASVSYVPKALYHYDYITNPDSASRGISPQKVIQGERFVSELRKLLPEEGYDATVDNQHLGLVYLAICSKAYSAKEFRLKYSFLSRVSWKDYRKKPFSIKIIIWTSLHISYNLALFMYGIKRTKRRLKL